MILQIILLRGSRRDYMKTFSAVLSVGCFSSSVKSVLTRTGWSLELVTGPQ